MNLFRFYHTLPHLPSSSVVDCCDSVLPIYRANIMIYRVAASLLVGSLSRVSASQSSPSHNFISKGILPHVDVISSFQSSSRHNFISKSFLPHRSIISLPAMPAFCEMCGSPTEIKIPDGDERERSICTNIECNHITYQNPKIVVGAICTYQDKVSEKYRAM